jgi:hypothetical protein
MKKTILLTVAAVAMLSAQQLRADTMLVNRGLPVSNLNNIAGANRSNVDWGSTSGVSLVGDTFTNTSSLTWSLSTIRLWTDGVLATPPTAKLWGGIDGTTPFGILANSGSLTPVTYSNGAGYQASGGSFYQLFQVDFAVNLQLAPGQTFSFFLDGNDPSYPPYIFAEASNAALSGVPQDGADGLLLQADVIGTALGNIQSWTSDANVSSVGPNGGWDKSSDLNVQVFGSVPDSGATLALLGLALIGLGALRRRSLA